MSQDAKQNTAKTTEVKIDPEFESLLPPLSPEAYQRLSKEIEKNGQQDSVKVWKEEGTALDGHNRLNILKELGVEPKLEFISLPSRAAAIKWVLERALAHRHMTPTEQAYVIGKRVNMESGTRGGNRKSKSQNETLNGSTAKRIAEELNISKATANRNAALARSLDGIADKIGEQPKVDILVGAIRLTNQQIDLLSQATKTQLKKAYAKGEPGMRELVEEIREKEESKKRQAEEKAQAKAAKKVAGKTAAATKAASPPEDDSDDGLVQETFLDDQEDAEPTQEAAPSTEEGDPKAPSTKESGDVKDSSSGGSFANTVFPATERIIAVCGEATARLSDIEGDYEELGLIPQSKTDWDKSQADTVIEIVEGLSRECQRFAEGLREGIASRELGDKIGAALSAPTSRKKEAAA